jgi:hypothetical protein
VAAVVVAAVVVAAVVVVVAAAAGNAAVAAGADPASWRDASPDRPDRTIRRRRHRPTLQGRGRRFLAATGQRPRVKIQGFAEPSHSRAA